MRKKNMQKNKKEQKKKTFIQIDCEENMQKKRN